MRAYARAHMHHFFVQRLIASLMFIADIIDD